MFVMVDGIDGSGKSTVTNAIRDRVRQDGHRTFDLAAWCKEHGDIPRFEDVEGHDVFFSAEPTKAWVGAAIRVEMIRAGSPYSGLEQAHAFSVDRLVLYRRLILPALAAGKTVVSDRGFTTSIVYQPVMPGGPTLEALLDLPGNRLALEHRPDHLVIATVPPKTALSRLPTRTDGDPEQVFERLGLLEAFDERFRAPWFEELFSGRGTTIHRLDTDCAIDEAKARAVKLVSSFLP